MLKKTLLSLAIATTVLSLAACNDTETVVDPIEPEITTEEVIVEPVVIDPMVEADPMADTMATQNIVEIAAGNDNLTILTAALQAAGLDQTLMTDGPFTVFAPTDAAFADLLAKLNVTQDELLANTDLLTTVLSYHVIPGMAVVAADIPYGNDIETVNGQAISISDSNIISDASGGIANIAGTDIMATNGVIHVIDSVLIPAS